MPQCYEVFLRYLQFATILLHFRWRLQIELLAHHIEGSPVNPNTFLALHILMDHYCFLRVNMLPVKYLPGFVTANRNKAYIDRTIPLTYTFKHITVACVPGMIERFLSSFENPASPQADTIIPDPPLTPMLTRN